MTSTPCPHCRRPVRLPKTGHVIDCIEVAPDKYQPADGIIPRDAVPRYGFIQLMRQQDGRYLPTMKSWGETVRMSVDLPETFGLDVDYNTIMRLIKAGFLRAKAIAPNSFLLDLASLWEHLEACSDPDFWTAKRRQQYREQSSRSM